MRATALLALALPFAIACGTSATSGSDGGADDGSSRVDGGGGTGDGGGLDGSIDPGGGTDGGAACACLPDPPVTGSTIAVHAGGDLQAALAQAQLGDEVVLDEGATFTGSFTLPVAPGAGGWVTLRSSGTPALPPCRRVTPSDASHLAKILAPGDVPAIATAKGAHHWRLVGLEIALAPSATTEHTLVAFGAGDETALSDLPHDLAVDRCYFHGSPSQTVRRGVGLHCAAASVEHSTIADIHEAGADAQAIAGWNGPGPFDIVDDELDASGENILFGGSDPHIAQLIPSDIRILYNHVDKPLSWRVGDPGYAGTHWTVKNSIELKNARRVLIDGNLVEHCWGDAQAGFSIVLTPRNQDGTAPWCDVTDVTFTHNVVRHVASAVNVLATDNDQPSGQLHDVLIRDNRFEDVDGATWGGAATQWQLLAGPTNVSIIHNTAFGEPSGGHLGAEDGNVAAMGFVFRDNLEPLETYGFFCSGLGDGNACLALFPGAIFTGNVLWDPYPGFSPSKYPAMNAFPSTIGDVGFVDAASQDGRLAPTSAWKGKASDGEDPGADEDAIDLAARCRTGG